MYVAVAAKLYLGRDEEGAAWLRRSIETNQNYPIAHFMLASALAHHGQMSDARAATQAGPATFPGCWISAAQMVQVIDRKDSSSSVGSSATKPCTL
jgi:hypothetical protein